MVLCACSGFQWGDFISTPGWVGCELDNILPCQPKPVRRVHFHRAPTTVDIRDYDLIILETKEFAEKRCHGRPPGWPLWKHQHDTDCCLWGNYSGLSPYLTRGFETPWPNALRLPNYIYTRKHFYVVINYIFKITVKLYNL